MEYISVRFHIYKNLFTKVVYINIDINKVYLI